MNKKLIIGILVIAIAVGVYAISGNNSGSSNGSVKDTLIVGTPRDPGILDPNLINLQMVAAVNKQIYETLFTKDDKGNLQPLLAESWNRDNDLTVTIKLRQGVKFHNGEELTADDVLFSLKRASTMGSSSPAVSSIDFEKSNAVDKYTVQLITKDVFVPMLDYLDWPLTAIFSRKAYEEANGDFAKCAIGTGAYKLKQYVSGDRIEFVAFDDYWGEPAHVKNLVMRIIPEGSSRTMELETGGVDIIYEAPATDLARLEENPDTKVYRDVSLCTQYLLIRTDHKPFDDVRVRQALAYAIDREEAVRVAYNGTGVVATGYCSPAVRDFAPDVKPYEYNPEKAKQLLAEAGYPNGFETTFHTDTGLERSALAENISNQLGKVGIKCDIIAMEPVSYQSMFPDGLHNMHLNGLTCTTGEGDKAFRWFHSKHPSGVNFCMWINPEYDNLVDTAVKTLDDNKRKEIYRQIQQMLHDSCIIIPMLDREILSAARSNVKGFKNDISYECPVLKNVYFEEPSK